MGFQDLADDDLDRPLTEPTLIANYGSLMLAIARRDGLSITPDDVAWGDAAVRGCAGSG